MSLSLNQKFLNNTNNITSLQTDYNQLAIDVAEAVSFHKDIVHDDANIKALADRATANAGNISTLQGTTDTQATQISDITTNVATNAQSIIDYNTQFQAKIDTEEARAIAAETANATAVVTEKTRAEGAELVLRNDLSAEATAARAAELVLRNDLSSEIARASTAEMENYDAIEAEATAARAAEGVLQANINSVSSDLSAEAVTARAAELVNANAITAENTRALGAEGVLQANINTVSGAVSTETSRAQSAESANATAVLTEKSRAEGAELVLTNALSTEVSRATAAESANTTALTQAVSDVGVAIAGVNDSRNIGLSKMVFSQTFEYDGDLTADSYLFSMGNGCPTEADFGCPIPLSYKLHAIGVCRKSDDVASDLSIQFKVEHIHNGVPSPITDVAMTGSSKQLFQVVSGAVAQNASGQVNVKFGAVNNVPSYGKYRVTLYMQSQDQFY